MLISDVIAEDNSACNNKYKNLVKLADILANDPFAKVPPFLSVSSERIEAFLSIAEPQFKTFYLHTLDQLNTELGRLVPNYTFWTKIGDRVKNLFSSPMPLHQLVLSLFTGNNFQFNTDEMTFFGDAQNKNIYLMVRSSGLEDSKTTANAGLYVSVPYVLPNPASVKDNMGKVVESYFNPQAIKNNLIAGLDLYTMPLCIPVLIQQLIGEPFGGTSDPAQIPISGVAFTTQSSLSSAQFKITEINASYGHGEGVVANKVSVDRYYVIESKTGNDLTIYPMISYKRQRLIPTATGLQFLENPDALMTKPCIATEEIKKLYAVLKKIEAAYDQPMDVEFVIQNGTIYIVQARPAMRFEQKPSYIPDAALTEAQRTTVIPVNTLVAGSSQICIVTDSNKLIITNTLDDADADIRRSAAQAVLVGAWASPLSHAAVNFIGFGIPCFYLQDLNAVKNLLPSISATQPLIIDTQRQLIYLWTNTQKNISTAIVQGWYEHPIARSLSIITGIGDFRIVRDIPVVPQDATLITIMSNLRNGLGSVDQKKLFDDAEQRINDRLRITDKRIQQKIRLCDTHCTQNFAAFKTTIITIMQRFKDAIERKAERLELLFYHKMLEALLYQENDGSAGINRYTYRWFLDDLFVKQGIIGAATVAEDLNTLFAYAKHCPGQELVTAWRTFINMLDTGTKERIIPQSEIDILKSLLTLIEKVDGLSIWFATIFYQELPRINPTETAQETLNILHTLNRDYSTATQEFMLFIQSIHNNIATAKLAVQQQLTTVPAVESFWREMHRLLIDPLTTNQFTGEFAQATFLGKLLLCEKLKVVIDLIDESIKIIKSSRVFSFSTRKTLFSMMLADFLHLCKTWLTNLMPEHAIVYSGAWPLRTYLAELDRLFNTIMNPWFVNSWFTLESTYFQKSTEFSVQAAILGTRTAFNRHFPQTPEDLFMLIHQNSLVAVGATYKSLFGTTPLATMIYMPSRFRTIFEYVDSESSVRKSLVGIIYDETTLKLSYNMPLNNHSGAFQLIYNFTTQEISVLVQYLGEARTRWEQIAGVAAASPDLSGLILDGPVTFDWRGGLVTWTWKVDSLDTMQTIVANLDVMNNISFNDISNQSLANINKTSNTVRAIFERVFPQFATRIRGNLQQNWQTIIRTLR